MIAKTLESFWDRVAVACDGECWPWLGPCDSSGYGIVMRRVLWRTHRLAWTTTFGDIPDGMHVLHHCDNAPCCNPTHLFLGTNADNVADKVRKGRQARGSSHVAAVRPGWSARKLTPESVTAIRSDQRQAKEIAADHGVSTDMVYLIRSRKAWRHVQ